MAGGDTQYDAAMAILCRDGQKLPLVARFEVGRDPRSALHVADPRVSSRHARVVWTREGWQLRDLGSTNGTTLDGQRVEPGLDYPLQRGAVITFGSPANAWVLTDAAPPQAMAEDARGVQRFAEEGLLALPSDDEPSVVILEQASGEWLAEFDGEPRAVKDQEELQVGEAVWRLHLPTVYAMTVAARSVERDQVGLRFGVSRDEEFVSIHVLGTSPPVEVPARAHHYMLLLLARAKQRDLADGQSPAAAGWLYTEELSGMLRTDQQQLNVSVHRARRQFAKLDAMGVSQLIERRRLTRQLRLGVELVEIETL